MASQRRSRGPGQMRRSRKLPLTMAEVVDVVGAASEHALGLLHHMALVDDVAPGAHGVVLEVALEAPDTARLALGAVFRCTAPGDVPVVEAAGSFEEAGVGGVV